MAKTEKLFNVVGTSNMAGEVKVRWGLDLVTRVKALTRVKHTDIKLIDLPEPMTKLAAVEYLNQQNLTGEEQFVVALKVAQLRKQAAQKAKKAAKRGEVTATKSGPSLEEIRARGTKTVTSEVSEA